MRQPELCSPTTTNNFPRNNKSGRRRNGIMELAVKRSQVGLNPASSVPAQVVHEVQQVLEVAAHRQARNNTRSPDDPWQQKGAYTAISAFFELLCAYPGVGRSPTQPGQPQASQAQNHSCLAHVQRIVDTVGLHRKQATQALHEQHVGSKPPLHPDCSDVGTGGVTPAMLQTHCLEEMRPQASQPATLGPAPKQAQQCQEFRIGEAEPCCEGAGALRLQPICPSQPSSPWLLHSCLMADGRFRSWSGERLQAAF